MVGKSNRVSQKYKVIRPYDVIFGTPNEQTQNQCQSLIRWLFIYMDLWIYGRFCLIMLEGATQELRNVAIARNFITSSPLPSIQQCCFHWTTLQTAHSMNEMKQNSILKRCKTIFSSGQYQPNPIFVIFLHRQNFWRIKFTPKNTNFLR